MSTAETIHNHNDFEATTAQFADLEKGFKFVKNCAENSFTRLRPEIGRKSFTSDKLNCSELYEFILG